jgi:hypothetical protein
VHAVLDLVAAETHAFDAEDPIDDGLGDDG